MWRPVSGYLPRPEWHTKCFQQTLDALIAKLGLPKSFKDMSKPRHSIPMQLSCKYLRQQLSYCFIPLQQLQLLDTIYYINCKMLVCNVYWICDSKLTVCCIIWPWLTTHFITEYDEGTINESLRCHWLSVILLVRYFQLHLKQWTP